MSGSITGPAGNTRNRASSGLGASPNKCKEDKTKREVAKKKPRKAKTPTSDGNQKLVSAFLSSTINKNKSCSDTELVRGLRKRYNSGQVYRSMLQFFTKEVVNKDSHSPNTASVVKPRSNQAINNPHKATEAMSAEETKQGASCLNNTESDNCNCNLTIFQKQYWNSSN